MSFDVEKLRNTFRVISRYLNTETDHLETTIEFIYIINSFIRLISKRIGYIDSCIMNNDQVGQKHEENELLKILFISAIMERDNELLAKTADLWAAIFKEAIMHYEANKHDSEKSYNSAILKSDLKSIVKDEDIYNAISSNIRTGLRTGFFEEFAHDHIQPLQKCFRLHAENHFTDFNDNYQIIGLMAEYGNMKRSKTFVEKLLYEVNSKFTGAEAEKNKGILKKSLEEIKKQNKSYKKFDDNSDVFDEAVGFLIRREIIISSLSDVYNAFSDEHNRTTIEFGKVKNRAQAGIIVRTISKYYFRLDEAVLDGVQLSKKYADTIKPYKYKELIKIIGQYENQNDYHGRKLFPKFLKTISDLTEILQRAQL